MKCKNCGAELNNGKCAYCGSLFPEDMRLFTLKKPEIDPGRCVDGTIPRPIIKDTIEITALGDNLC